ncbi:hypothetical protein P9139_00105 [Curtobacterium flaccumfaciens]|nr:hypothetical protein P9139_00105 [Curtobacterium flaccumfaciens]
MLAHLRGLSAAASSRSCMVVIAAASAGVVRGLGWERGGQRPVHLGERGTEFVGFRRERRALPRVAERHAPGVLEARQELLREGEVSCGGAVGTPGVGPGPTEGAVDAGTRALPAAESASCVVTSGLSPWCRTRKTFTMTCSPASVSQMTEVFDCSPLRTLEAVTEPIGRRLSSPASMRAARARIQSASAVASRNAPASSCATGAW